MFRSMRRNEKELDKITALHYLEQAKEGILSTISSDNGYPYGIAVNHVVIDGCIYFHSARSGHKISNIYADNRVSFFVIHKDDIDPEGYTTRFESVHVFGRAFCVTDEQEYKRALLELARKFTGEFFDKAESEIANAMGRTAVIRIEIEDLKGKSNA